MNYKIKPQGWLKGFLETQMQGLTGHIEEAGYPFGIVEWGKPDVISQNGEPSWWAYEQTGYWLDGYLRCAILTNDNHALKTAQNIIYNVLKNADADGYLGPKFLKNPEEKERPGRWAHVVFFRSCMALYDYNQDHFIVQAMEKHYLSDKESYSYSRDILNVEIMLWLYEKTGNQNLLQLAEESYKTYNENCQDDVCDKVALSDRKPNTHGVSYNEYSKLGAILYLYTKKDKYLEASIAAYKKIDKYFMLPDGLHSSNEYLTSNNIMNCHETCCISDYTWSLYYLYEATKKTSYLDKIEKCIFNAGLGAVTEDFKALQYFSGVNQLVLTNNSNHNDYHKGNRGMSYRPRPMTACCSGNVSRFMPNYILNMWSASEDDVWLKLYGASEFAHNGIKIVEDTNFPYENVIRLTIESEKSFKLHLRYPKWADGYELQCNKSMQCTEKDGYITLNVDSSCELSIKFACDIKKHKKNNCVWFSKGCLVYTFAPEYRKEIDKNEIISSNEFPAYNICVSGEWAYGVAEDSQIEENEDGTLSLEVYKISNWHLQKKKKTRAKLDGEGGFVFVYKNGDYCFTPPLPTKPIIEVDSKKSIKLIPYGNSICRITAFPRIKK